MLLKAGITEKKIMSSKCTYCNGSGESFDKSTFRRIECDYCDGTGHRNNYNEYRKESKKKKNHRKPKLGRDFDINFDE